MSSKSTHLLFFDINLQIVHLVVFSASMNNLTPSWVYADQMNLILDKIRVIENICAKPWLWYEWALGLLFAFIF